MKYTIHTTENGGLTAHRNIDFEDLDHISQNFEAYESEADFESRLAWIQEKIPDQVTLPDEVGSNSDADLAG